MGTGVFPTDGILTSNGLDDLLYFCLFLEHPWSLYRMILREVVVR
jgi:hypothetical protein